MQIERTVEHRWSLWTTEREEWDQRAPGIWEEMRQVFEGTLLLEPETIEDMPETIDSLKLYVGSSKEIRSGVVIIEQGRAWVSMRAGWDSIPELMETHGLDPDDDDQVEQVTLFFQEGGGFDESGDPCGAQIDDQEVSAESFEELMQGIDEIEDALIAQEKEASADFDLVVEGIKTERG